MLPISRSARTVRASTQICQRSVCESVACAHTEDTYSDGANPGTAACYKCKGGEWGCPDFKIGKNTSTFKCECTKKTSGTCASPKEYDTICVDPGWEVSGGAAVRNSMLVSLGLASASLLASSWFFEL